MSQQEARDRMVTRLLRTDADADGKSDTRLYRIYNGMLQRCHNPDSHDYKWYGAKGVHVCEEWKDDFMAFHEWAMSHGYHDGLTIDRKNPNGGYSPGNCRWVTDKQNKSRVERSTKD